MPGTSNLNSYGDISPRTAGKAAKKLLQCGQYLMVTERFGYVDPQPLKSSKTRKWRRYESLPPATAPLAEGISPQGQKITYTDYTCTLEQYGDLVNLTDVIQDTHEDPVLNEMMERCGRAAAETVELLRIATLKGGTNVFYADNVTSRSAVNSPATRGDFRRIKRQFSRMKAEPIGKIIKASEKISTESVAPAYFAMGHTDLDSDLRDVPKFLDVKDYANSDKSLPGEIGSIESVRIILTPLFKPWTASGASGTTYLSNGVEVSESTACDVYPLIVVAKDAYAIVPLQGKSAIKPAVMNPDKISKSDELGQRGFVSWKTWQGSVILNQNWIARLEVAATAVPE